jgi:hypothetical protein
VTGPKAVESVVEKFREEYGAASTARLEAHVDTNPIRPAERRYVQEHGSAAYAQLLGRLFDELFPAGVTTPPLHENVVRWKLLRRSAMKHEDELASQSSFHAQQ